MQKPKDNTFITKFRLLCSQENNEDINWSSSESSEYEIAQNDKIHNITLKNQNRKRKRKKALKNISNLDVTIIDTTCDQKAASNNEIKSFSSNKKCICDRQTSPILTTQRYSKVVNTVSASPIISSKLINQHNKKVTESKSPILVLKTASPTYSHKVRKKLFTNDSKFSKSKSLILDENNDEQTGYKLNTIESRSTCNKDTRNNLFMNNIELQEKTMRIDIDKLEVNQRQNENEECVNMDGSTEMFKLNNFDIPLVKKENTYFESHFSSESTSQYSINDSPTPKNSSKTSDDIEIINSISQLPSNRNSPESIKEDLLENVNLKSKKARYKKGGLAYRLNSLLKKHNANISLWHHERFLAVNSDFVIPKAEHLVFRIRKIQSKYGCYLLEAKNLENETFFILINAVYVTDCNFSENIVFKLFEPYKIIDYNEDYKFIINVCKFEVVDIKT